MENDTTIPSLLGPINTIPSGLGPIVGNRPKPHPEPGISLAKIAFFMVLGTLLVFVVRYFAR
ncbi:MAG: hypothetical protein RL211_2251 [Pseudomonadota bacterium]|jgi:hypothetical protein